MSDHRQQSLDLGQAMKQPCPYRACFVDGVTSSVKTYKGDFFVLMEDNENSLTGQLLGDTFMSKVLTEWNGQLDPQL